MAAGILRDAARHIAEAAAAVCPAGAGGEVALTGGLFRHGRAPPGARCARSSPRGCRRPGSPRRPRDPLDGALRIAAALAAGELRLPLDAGLLSVVTE